MYSRRCTGGGRGPWSALDAFEPVRSTGGGPWSTLDAFESVRSAESPSSCAGERRRQQLHTLPPIRCTWGRRVVFGVDFFRFFLDLRVFGLAGNFGVCFRFGRLALASPLVGLLDYFPDLVLAWAAANLGEWGTVCREEGHVP